MIKYILFLEYKPSILKGNIVSVLPFLNEKITIATIMKTADVQRTRHLL
jgi:hypothetical protein